MQLLEHVVAEDPANVSYEGATHFMGSYDSSAGFVAPALQSFVAIELGNQSAILKGKRKGGEAKNARHITKGKGKHGSQHNDGA